MPVVAVELVPVMGPGCWAAAGAALADRASTKTAIRRGYPIASSFEETRRATGEAEVWFPCHNPLRALAIFQRSAQKDLNTPALMSLPVPTHRACRTSVDHALAPPHDHAGSAGARGRPGSRRLGVAGRRDL